jgi:hypothetical protein
MRKYVSNSFFHWYEGQASVLRVAAGVAGGGASGVAVDAPAVLGAHADTTDALLVVSYPQYRAQSCFLAITPRRHPGSVKCGNQLP